MVRVQHLWLTWLLQDSVVPRLLWAEGSALCKKRWLRPQPLTAGLPVEFGAEVQRWGERQLFRWSQVWLFVHQHHSHIRSAPLSLSALTFFHCFIQSSAPHFYSTIFPLPQYPLLFSSPPVSRPVCSFLPPDCCIPALPGDRDCWLCLCLCRAAVLRAVHICSYSSLSQDMFAHFTLTWSA